jgi:chromosome partitioning protein
MSTIIAIASHKGGVGKTTTALNLGYSLSRFGDRVLVVDADPQASLTVATNLRKRAGRGLVHVLRGEAPLKDVLLASRQDALSFASLGVAGPEDAAFFEEKARSGAVTELLRAAAEPYDFLIVDPPAGIGSIVTAVLQACDGVVMPILPRALTLRTLASFLRTIQFVRRGGNPRLRIEGVVVTMFREDSRGDARVLEEIRGSFPEDIFFQTVIPANDLFEEATLQSVPVAMLPGGQKPARAYLDLAMELRQRTLAKEEHDDAAAPGLF